MTEQGPSAEVLRDDVNDRYVLRVDGLDVGAAYFAPDGANTVFTHTVVDRSHQHHGYASLLIGAALDDVRDGGGTFTPQCPFVAAFVNEHPEYEADVIPEV